MDTVKIKLKYLLNSWWFAKNN